MSKLGQFRYFRTGPQVTLYVRFFFSLRTLEDLIHESGIEISYYTDCTPAGMLEALAPE